MKNTEYQKNTDTQARNSRSLSGFSKQFFAWFFNVNNPELENASSCSRIVKIGFCEGKTNG